MKSITLIARLLLGFIFLVFGSDYFFHFIDKIVSFPDIGDKANNYLGAFAATGYFFPILKSIEIVCGVLLLINRYAAFIAVVVFPITLNIFLFDAFMAPSLLYMGGGMMILNVILLYAYRRSYSSILASKP
ncbi:DoxX family membrane protein [Mucilaginibacter terrigena]|uniref:DoxX family membrane protein n=1 Tax=Mucilaginibacter terrigena TaxID=2492395 RepID=A0A4Q5LL69_9SPHI|nr:DoxX family membrane protein [Mucilaginibacter terrigena]RYU90307.1 DoxX family membrane protein [Mucilaginibacter terrigena]